MYPQDKVSIQASVIVLNFNGTCYLQNLFSSLNSQSFSNFEIVFVDNASSDDSVEIARLLSKKMRKDIAIKIVTNRKNEGYCRGNNIGVSFASATSMYIVFLNNDTSVETNWLKELILKAKSNDSIGIVGSWITQSRSCSTSSISIYGFDAFGQCEPVNIDRDTSIISDVKFFYCSGASFLIKKNVFFEAGCFDEALFMYNDETDLSWRVRLCGYEVAFAADSICYHHTKSVSYGIALPPWKYYHGVVKNRSRILTKNYSTFSLLKYFSLALALITFRGFMSTLINANVSYLTALFKGLFWNLKNIKSTIQLRNKIQSIRKVPDAVIVNYMLPYPAEIMYFKMFLGNTLDTLTIKKRSIL